MTRSLRVRRLWRMARSSVGMFTHLRHDPPDKLNCHHAFQSPPPTTVVQPMQITGEIAAQTLIDRIDNGLKAIPEIKIQPEVVVRQSTARYSPRPWRHGPGEARRRRTTTAPQRVPALNWNTVTLWNFCPGFNSVEGKLAWLGESGKCWVSRQNANRRL